MNKEVIKVINKKENKNNIGKWWRDNNYKILRAILFPIWITVVVSDKYNSYMDSKQSWDEEKATEILNYYIPRASDFDMENNTFYFFDNGIGWTYNRKRYIKHKDRRFWKVNCRWSGGNIRKYLIEKFELEGFTKEVGNCHDEYTDIIFTMISNN